MNEIGNGSVGLFFLSMADRPLVLARSEWMRSEPDTRLFGVITTKHKGDIT